MALSGFTWPTAGPKPAETNVSSGAGTPKPTTSAGAVVVSSAKVPEASVSMGPDAPGLVSSVPVADSPASQSGNSGFKTTHVQITRTVTVQPAPTGAPVTTSSVSPSSSHSSGHTVGTDGLLTTHIQVTHTTTIYPSSSDAPPAKAVQLAELPPGLPPQFTPSPQATTSPKPVDKAAIAGGIIGGIIGVVALLVLIRWLQKRKAYPNVQRPPRHDQNTPFPQRRRGDIPMGHVNAHGRNHGGANRRNSDGLSPAAIAQAMGWATPFAADNFARTPTRGGGVMPGPRYPAPMPARHYPRGGRRDYRRSSPVSPLAGGYTFAQARPAGYHYDVSPL
ncbi:hypothetical protein NX059_002870 [Plenodomus lindquistii]|nr:hypothetical protein NX059_002870 [Plenodomus lindquistii]